MKKRNFFIVLFILALFPSFVKANDDYNINSYNIDISVKDKEYSYNETIDLSYNKKNVIITKEIPQSSTDLDVDYNHIILSNPNKVIEINSNENLRKHYTYKYKNIVENKKDIYSIEIYNTFNNDLNNIKFSITLPESFNKNNIEFYLNDEKIDGVYFKIKRNTISGVYEKLNEGDLLEVRIDYSKIYLSRITIISIVTPVILAFISFIIWFIYGKDLRFTTKKTPKLSSKLTLLDISLLNKGIATNDDSFYFLLSLANKGYIKIVENNYNDYTFVLTKEYDGKSYKEASFIKALFKKNKSITLTDYINVISEHKVDSNQRELDKEIPNNEIKARFKRATNNVLSIINANEEKKKYFEDKSDNKKVYLTSFITIILILVTSLPFVEINHYELLPLSVIFSIFTLFLLISFVDNVDLNKKKNKRDLLIILSVIILIVMLFPAFRRNRIYMIAYLISCISVSIILFLYKYMPKRTIYGSKEFSKIEGLKLFINEMDHKDLDAVLELNDNYLYDILPVSYLLENSEKVLSYMKEYKIKKPSWFVLKDDFTVQKLSNSINRLKILLEYEEDY